MRNIEFFFSEGNNIVVTDDSDENIDEYIKKLSSLFESNAITIFHTSSESIILRPNKLTSIKVINIEDKVEDVKEETIKKQNEDIITD